MQEHSRADSSHMEDLSLAQTLPYDILNYVFILCLPSGFDRLCRVHPDEIPLLLTHVCSWWREVALSSPAIWPDLHLEIPHCHPSYELGISFVVPYKQVEQMQTCLARAAHIPPSLRLEFRSSCVDVYGPALPGVTLLNLCSDVVRHLEVCCDDNPFILHDAPIQSFPTLESLVLWRRSANDTFFSFRKPPPFPNAPNLRRLTISKFLYLSDNLPSLSDFFPWARLTHFVTTCFMGSSTWANTMPLLTGLQEGLFFLDTQFQDGVPKSTIIPSLRKLTLIFATGYFDVSDLFFHMTFPALKKLQISFCQGQSPITDASWTAILHTVPALSELYIGPHAAFSLFALLRGVSAKNPMLESLYLCGPFNLRPRAGPQLIINILYEFLQKRRERYTLIHLKRIILLTPLGYESDFKDEVAVALAPLIEEGLDICVVDGPNPYQRCIPRLYDFQSRHPRFEFEEVRNAMMADYEIMRP